MQQALPVKDRASSADSFSIRWVLVIGGGVTGLLLGGAGVGAVLAVLALVAARLARFLRTPL
jgi:hypothetical protein